MFLLSDLFRSELKCFLFPVLAPLKNKQRNSVYVFDFRKNSLLEDLRDRCIISIPFLGFKRIKQNMFIALIITEDIFCTH